jgi:beta-fructofuranosidase
VPGQRRERRPSPALVSLKTDHSSALPGIWARAAETAPVRLEKGEHIKLRIFIDKSVVEVFINGKQCVAARVYPGRDDSVGVSVRAQGGSGKLLSLDAWQMKNIYED